MHRQNELLCLGQPLDLNHNGGKKIWLVWLNVSKNTPFFLKCFFPKKIPIVPCSLVQSVRIPESLSEQGLFKLCVFFKSDKHDCTPPTSPPKSPSFLSAAEKAFFAAFNGLFLGNSPSPPPYTFQNQKDILCNYHSMPTDQDTTAHLFVSWKFEHLSESTYNPKFFHTQFIENISLHHEKLLKTKR